MRKLSPIFLVLAAPLSVLLGVIYLLGAGYQQIIAEVETKDLSVVAGDLLSPEDLAREQAAAAARKADNEAAGRAVRFKVLGVVLLGAALLQLVGGVLGLLGRARPLVFGAAATGLAAVLAAALVDRFVAWGALAGALLLLSLLFGLAGRQAAPTPPT